MYCQGLCKKQVVLFTQALHVHVNSKKIKSKTSASFRSIHYRNGIVLLDIKCSDSRRKTPHEQITIFLQMKWVIARSAQAHVAKLVFLICFLQNACRYRVLATGHSSRCRLCEQGVQPLPP